MLLDPCRRPVTNLRISVTQECNQRCLYCHREGETAAPAAAGGGRRARGRNPAARPPLLTADDIERVAKVASSLGISKVKFTGGEPLTRRDLPTIIRRAAPFFEDLSLTTNGTLLAPLAGKLRAAGLNRVNVSLDSARPGTYERITGTPGLEAAVAGIRSAVKAGLRPVKLNMVVLRGVNDREIAEMVHFASEEGAMLQLIELEGPKGTLTGDWYSNYHADLMDIESELGRMAIRTRRRKLHHRRKYLVPAGALDRFGEEAPGAGPGTAEGRKGGAVEVEVVRPVHNSEFCANCNRLRLSSDGKLVPCLFRRDLGVDILGPLRRGASDEGLRRLFVEAVSRREPYWSKPAPPLREKGKELGACS